MSSEFGGLVAIVTGGGSGIGAAIVQELLDRGAKVAAFDLDPSAVPEGVLGVTADVSDDGSVTRGVQEVVDAWGRVDVLVNNAGIGAQGSVEDNPDDEWMRVFDVNVLGMVRMSRAALPHLRRSPRPQCRPAHHRARRPRTLHAPACRAPARAPRPCPWPESIERGRTAVKRG